MHSIISTLLSLLVVTLANGHPFITNNIASDQQKISNCGASSCLDWYNKEGDPAALLALTLTPPCQIPKSFPETMNPGWSTDPGCKASSQPNTCDLHKGAHGCYRHSHGKTGPGAQACYNSTGGWIADPWQGAGTLDAETPLGGIGQAVKHGLVDVLPYNWCCQTTSILQPCSCNLYYEKRPPGECAGEITA